jgi:hypothetical protein
MKGGTLVLLLVGLLLMALPCEAMKLREPRNARHDRISSSTNEINRNFLFYDYDASGIAINQNTLDNAGRATLITRRHFVTASHTAGTHPGFVTFMNQDGEEKVYAVSHFDKIQESTDLTIGTLRDPVPEADGITHYPVARVVPPDYDNAMIGIFSMQQLAGINRLESGAAPESEFFRHDFDNSDSGTWGRGGDEAMPTMGDSGHAMVAAYSGRLFVLGTHYTTESSQSVPKHIDRIQEIVAAEGETVEVVDTLPRTIADFNPQEAEGIWQNGGILGGTLPANEAGQPVGRIGSTISFHHLYAANDGGRPELLETGSGKRVLQFDGTDELLADDTDRGTVQAFMFELNTEQPRIFLVGRVDRRETGTSTLIELRYSSGPSTLALEYDHGTKRLRATGMGATAEIPAFEESWFLAELVRERQTVGLSLNGSALIKDTADHAFNGNTDFQSLSIGNAASGDSGLQGQIGRIVFKDTGEDRDEELTESLMQDFGIAPLTNLYPPIQPDPAGGFLLSFLLETARSADGPWETYQLRESALSVVDGKVHAEIRAHNSPSRFLRISNGIPLQVPAEAFTLVLEPSVSASLSGPWQAHSVQPEGARVREYRLLVELSDAPDPPMYFKLSATP